jgi:hypothetical protein
MGPVLGPAKPDTCGRPEVMAWCEAKGLEYIFGLPGNVVLDRLMEPIADDVRVRRAEAQAAVVRRYTEARYGANSWGCIRRVARFAVGTRVTPRPPHRTGRAQLRHPAPTLGV